MDELRGMRLRLNLLAKPLDRGIDRPCIRRGGIAPYFAKHLIAMNDNPLMLSEVLEQRILEVAEVNQSIPIPRLQGFEIHCHRTERQTVKVRTGSPKDGVNPGDYLFQVKRLRHVVVGAEIQTTDPVV